MKNPRNQTLHNQTTQNKLSQERKLNLEDLKRIMNSEKTTLPSLRNIEWRIVKAETNKVNQVLTYISTNNITELNELIYAGAKLVWRENWDTLKKHERKIKTMMGISTINSDKKSTKTGKNDKTKERRRIN